MKKWRTVKYVLVLLTQPLTHSLYLYAWLDSFWWRKKLTLIPSPNKNYIRFLSSGIFYSRPERKLLLYISKWGGGLLPPKNKLIRTRLEKCISHGRD